MLRASDLNADGTQITTRNDRLNIATKWQKARL